MQGALFLLESAMVALALAFESFMVALANGLNNAKFGFKRCLFLAVLFGACHAVELFAGYWLANALSQAAPAIDEISCWIAFAFLMFLGVKTVVEGIRCAVGRTEKIATSTAGFVAQSAVAALDALAVGFTVSDHSVSAVTVTASIILSVIVVFYSIGFFVGKKFGTKLGKYAAVIGGLVYIGLAVEVLVESIV